MPVSNADPTIGSPEQLPPEYQTIVAAVREVAVELGERTEARCRLSLEAAIKDFVAKEVARATRGRQLPADAQAEGATGIFAAGCIRMIAAAKRSNQHPATIAEKQYGADHPVTKAMAASTGEAGGFTVPGQFVAEIIELLRARAVVEGAGPRAITMPSGTITISKQTSAGSAAWLGENENLVHGRPGTGNVTLTAKKLGGLVAVSNDLLKYSAIDIDGFVRDDLVQVVQLAEDLAFLRGDGLSAQPKGFLYTTGKNGFAANTTVTLATVTNELGRAMQELMSDNVAMVRPHWFWNPRTWRYLFTIQNSLGLYAFQQELNSGRLFGIPWSNTTQIPVNLGAGTDSEVYLVEMDTIVIGRTGAMEVDASAEAAYFDGTAVQSSFSRDQTVVRVLDHVDIVSRHAEGICVIDTVRWAA